MKTRLVLLGLLLSGTACIGEPGGDEEPPTVQITSPLDGATVSGVVNFTAQAGDDVGLAAVEFFVGSTMIGEDGVAPYSWLWNTANTPTGPVVIRARAVDLVNNAVEHQISVTVIR